MNAGVQKILSLGASLGIGAGLGIFAKQGRVLSPPIPPPVVVVEEEVLVHDESRIILPGPLAELPGKFPPAEAREFRQLADAEKLVLADLLSGYRSAADQAERSRILDRIEDEFYGREVLGLAAYIYENRERLGASQSNRVTTMLAGNTSPEILPVLSLAYPAESEVGKARLLMAAVRVRGEDLLAFISRGFEDSSSSVRFAALDVVDHQDSRTRKALLLLALRSTKEDVALAGLGELEVDATPDSLPIIMEGLSSRNSDVREETKGTLQFLLDEEFSDSETAMQWWQRNRHRFDRNLMRAN